MVGAFLTSTLYSFSLVYNLAHFLVTINDWPFSVPCFIFYLPPALGDPISIHKSRHTRICLPPGPFRASFVHCLPFFILLAFPKSLNMLHHVTFVPPTPLQR